LSHRRYFETSIAPAGASVQLLDGWYAEEHDDHESWRWMSRHARVSLLPLPGRGRLDLTLMAPLDIAAAPLITVMVDGNVIDRYLPSRREFQSTYIISSGGKRHDVTIDVSQTVNPRAAHLAEDPRNLGLKLHSILWGAAP
jgi:hypothetical protein